LGYLLTALYIVTSEVQLERLSSYKFRNPATGENDKTGLASDWALVSLYDEYIKPNSVLLEGFELSIALTGYLSTSELTAGKVWMCSSRGPLLVVLVKNLIIIGTENTIFKTRGIGLESKLGELLLYPFRSIAAYI
jgi:hypothetical protein